VSGLAAAAATHYPSLPHEPVALKDGEVRANAIVRKTDRWGELVNRAVATT
jgi:hypothetical protein